jgi:hypothetical protein
MRRTLAAGVVVTALALGPAAATAAAPEKITFDGVGQVKLGMTHKQLREKGLVGKLRKGCELGGPDTRTARLRSPLRGSVNYTLNSPRRVTDITITGGATARGVGIGDKLKDIKAKFPKRKVDHSQEDVFNAFFVFIPKANPVGKIKMMFVIDSDTRKITAIGVPVVQFCE